MTSHEQSSYYLRGHHFKELLRAQVVGADTYAANETARFESKRGTINDNTPVIFGLGKDAICGSCIFGSHCATDAGNRERDIAGMQAVDRLIREIGKGDETMFHDNPNDDTYRLVTSAGVVRGLSQALQEVNPNFPDMEFVKAARNPQYSPFEPRSPSPLTTIGFDDFAAAVMNLNRS